MTTLAQLRVAILGAGNIGSAIALGLVHAQTLRPQQIHLTRRNADLLARFRELGFKTGTDNRQAIADADLVFLAVTPQQLNLLLDDIAGVLDGKKHTIVSIVSGATIEQIRKHLGQSAMVVRAMPNTAVAIRESMTCLSCGPESAHALTTVSRLFDALGQTLVIDESLMVPATALCACGIAFFLRAIRAASQGGIEIGFHAEDALLMAAQTARGAASLLVQGKVHPEGEVDKVTTPMGCTIAGLNQMEHNGFSSALIKGIVTSADKAKVLYAPADRS
jgi:pyrroline-5-carboxylate reductase